MRLEVGGGGGGEWSKFEKRDKGNIRDLYKVQGKKPLSTVLIHKFLNRNQE